MELPEIVKDLAYSWKTDSTKSIKDLEYALMDSMRNLDFDENGPSISGLLATPILNNGDIPSNVLHLVLGVVSDTVFEAQLNIGERDVSKAFTITPFTHTPILKGWPIVDYPYHVIRVLGIPKGSRVWALGVRVKKSILTSIYDTRVPGHILYKNGLTYPDDGNISDKTWLKFI